MKTEIVQREPEPSPEMGLARSPMLDQDYGVLGNAVLVVSLRLAGMSPLMLRPIAPRSQALTTQLLDGADMIRQVKVILHDGAITVNGKEMRIPPGLAGPMTGKEFKRFAGIYPGNALFIQRNGGLQRVRDSEPIEIVPNSKFTHRRESPAVRSVPRFGHD